MYKTIYYKYKEGNSKHVRRTIRGKTLAQDLKFITNSLADESWIEVPTVKSTKFQALSTDGYNFENMKNTMTIHQRLSNWTNHVRSKHFPCIAREDGKRKHRALRETEAWANLDDHNNYDHCRMRSQIRKPLR